MKQRSLVTTHIVGFFVVVLLGSALHFVYEWSGDNIIVAAIGSVNESVWEHLKLGFWPVLLFLCFELFSKDFRSRGFLFAKAMGVLLLNLFIVVFFYTYTSFTGEDILWLDILSFVLAAGLCQIASYQLLMRVRRSRSLEIIGALSIVFMAFLFIRFTYATPHISLFEETESGTYGLESAGHDH